jgi:uncharacterized membrane protein YebE (DUF533 family)
MEDQKKQLLIRIAIGAAWADGRLEASEVEYFEKMLAHQGLADDPKFMSLVQVQVPQSQLELWLVQYLRQTTTSERLETLATIANLLMADGFVSSREHDFLDEFHALMAAIPPQPEALSQAMGQSLGQSVGRFVRQVIQTTKQVITGP